jgi:hypothetical protein
MSNILTALTVVMKETAIVATICRKANPTTLMRRYS